MQRCRFLAAAPPFLINKSMLFSVCLRDFVRFLPYSDWVVSMLKVTYTETGLCLEYCPEPLSFLLSDRVCTHARAQRPITVQPIEASIPLAATVLNHQTWPQLQTLALTRCDQDWYEVTLSGLWLTEDPDAAVGIFMTELDTRLEQRLVYWWSRSQQPAQKLIA